MTEGFTQGHYLFEPALLRAAAERRFASLERRVSAIEEIVAGFDGVR